MIFPRLKSWDIALMLELGTWDPMWTGPTKLFWGLGFQAQVIKYGILTCSRFYSMYVEFKYVFRYKTLTSIEQHKITSHDINLIANVTSILFVSFFALFDFMYLVCE